MESEAAQREAVLLLSLFQNFSSSCSQPYECFYIKALVVLHCVRICSNRVAVLFRPVTIQTIPLKSAQVTKHAPLTNYKSEYETVVYPRLTAPITPQFHP
jgi:hypothetical protein